MARRSTPFESAGQSLPSSVTGLQVHRRSLLKGGLGTAAVLGSSGLLAACGGDDGGSGGGGGGGGDTVKFGINEVKGVGAAYDRLIGMAEAYEKETGVTVELNSVEHNTFQESLNTYLQGAPDDVFTWFAGFRMTQLAENGLITDVSDAWPIDGLNDAFKEASTAPDGKQYFVPKDFYPWAVFYRKSIFEDNNWTPPENFDDLQSLAQEMQGKNIVPFAFADKQGWPAMGTFDILNMRLNGYDFHMALMAGDEAWDSNEVKKVFETWRDLLPLHQADPLGRNWEEAATSLSKGEAGMYLLGSFVADAIPKVQDDLDFFTFPALDDSIGAGALDAPIDGFCVAAGGPNQEAGKEMIAWLGTADAANAANSNAEAPFIAANENADTSSYSELQKKSAEVVGAAENIAQFLDRDTNSDFANTVVVPALQDFLKTPDDIDGITASIEQQKQSIF